MEDVLALLNGPGSAPASVPASAPARTIRSRSAPAGATLAPDGVPVALAGGGTLTAASGTVTRGGVRMPAFSMRYTGPGRADVHVLQFVEQWLEFTETGSATVVEPTGMFPAVMTVDKVPTRVREKDMRLSTTKFGASSNVDTKAGKTMYYDEAFGARRPCLTRRVEIVDAPYTDPTLLQIFQRPARRWSR
jgi:hypothetical protein